MFRNVLMLLKHLNLRLFEHAVFGSRINIRDSYPIWCKLLEVMVKKNGDSKVKTKGGKNPFRRSSNNMSNKDVHESSMMTTVRCLPHTRFPLLSIVEFAKQTFVRRGDVSGTRIYNMVHWNSHRRAVLNGLSSLQLSTTWNAYVVEKQKWK